jgi:hypothetical protein
MYFSYPTCKTFALCCKQVVCLLNIEKACRLTSNSPGPTNGGEYLGSRQEMPTVVEHKCPAGIIPFEVIGIGKSWTRCDDPGYGAEDTLTMLR